MKLSRPLIGFFSQTGSEIVELEKRLGIRYSLIVTNNSNLEVINENLRSDERLLVTKKKTPTVQDYLEILMYFEQPLVTLHGWLRIIPKDICEQYEICNGHPGLISTYGELKGKDPQEKVLNQKERYPIIGSVVHRVTPGVDEGTILISASMPNRANTVEEIYQDLRQTSLLSWIAFLNNAELLLSLKK